LSAAAAISRSGTNQLHKLEFHRRLIIDGEDQASPIISDAPSHSPSRGGKSDTQSIGGILDIDALYKS
jgi:hypothetical protein